MYIDLGNNLTKRSGRVCGSYDADDAWYLPIQCLAAFYR